MVEIRGDKYAEVIDNAPKEALVIMHIYDEVSCLKAKETNETDCSLSSIL